MITSLGVYMGKKIERKALNNSDQFKEIRPIFQSIVGLLFCVIPKKNLIVLGRVLSQQHRYDCSLMPGKKKRLS